MAKKPLDSIYELPNVGLPLTDDELRQAFTDFRYLTANCMQVVDKNRRLVPLQLNRMQTQFFETLLPMIDPKTRLDKHRTVVWLKPRQGGGTVGLIAFLNYICSFAEGIENFSIIHSLPVTDTISKLTKKKVEPIITGIHPDIMPTIEKEVLGTGIMYNYKDILGIPRHNFYELVSANTSSIRSDTINIWIADEVAFYRKPEELEDTIGGAMPDNGFSLTVFISTFDDMKGSFFKKKISDSIDNPETMDFIFTPWFYVYPEKPMGYTLEDIELSDYDTNVIMPAFEKFKYPKELWADAIKWYHNKSLTVSNMKKEFPTTLEEIMALGENKCVFSNEALDWQRQKIELGMPCTLVTDKIDKSVKAVETDVSSFKIFRHPQAGHKYIEVVDPITAQNEDTDFFAMSIFDTQTLEQVATFMDKDMSVEDYADICVSAAKIYNRATICPESNVADALLVCIRALGYYNLYYESPQKRVKKDAGIRTSVSTKAAMIDKLIMLMEQHKIILHDEKFINQLGTFEKKVKTRADGSQTVKLEARKGHHDDGVAVAWIFAGTLDQRQMMGSKHSGFAIL